MAHHPWEQDLEASVLAATGEPLTPEEKAHALAFVDGFRAGRRAEREACAQMAKGWRFDCSTLGDAIRARGQS